MNGRIKVNHVSENKISEGVFHMERDIIEKWMLGRKTELKTETIDKMLLLAKLIHETNQTFNLTGLKTEAEILAGLILKSIDPVCDITVPRGTSFADIGTGAGIPGIPISLFFKDFKGLLIDSNQKKTEFIKAVIEKLELDKTQVAYGRAEEIVQQRSYREQHDWCFARAFGKLQIVLELGAPFVKINGYLYIYSNQLSENLPGETLKHSENLGLNIMSHKEMNTLGLTDQGLCFKKINSTPSKYPRKYPTIKREADKI